MPILVRNALVEKINKTFEKAENTEKTLNLLRTSIETLKETVNLIKSDIEELQATTKKYPHQKIITSLEDAVDQKIEAIKQGYEKVYKKGTVEIWAQKKENTCDRAKHSHKKQ